jgi:hypothetical protein
VSDAAGAPSIFGSAVDASQDSVAPSMLARVTADDPDCPRLERHLRGLGIVRAATATHGSAGFFSDLSRRRAPLSEDVVAHALFGSGPNAKTVVRVQCAAVGDQTFKVTFVRARPSSAWRARYLTGSG